MELRVKALRRQYEYEVEEEYTVTILEVTLTAKDLNVVVAGRMNEEQREIYAFYNQTHGLTQQFYKPLDLYWYNYVSSYYGWRINPVTGQEQLHRGVDIAVPTGTTVYAAMDGTVTTATYDSYYGNYVVIEDEKGYCTKYAHMDTLNVRAGQSVTHGNVIGTTGNTGSSTGSHLHIECLYQGEYYNPLFYFEAGTDTLYGETPGSGSGGGNVIPPDSYDDATVQALMEEAARYLDYAEDMIGVDVGSVIKLTIGDQEIPVTVSGLLINDGLKNGHGPLALDSTCMVATKELFQEAMPKINCFDYSWSIVSDPKKAEQIENSLSAIISSNPDLDLDTIGIHKDYEEMENRVVFGGFQALSWLVFLFGVVNLINTTLSNQMSRKRENSVFRAIGLTRKQLCQMTIYEGICYAFSAALATLAVGLPIAIIAARKFSEMTFHVAMPYSFPFLQMGLFVLVLFGLEVILSFWTMRRQKNQSLVEEMRAME